MADNQIEVDIVAQLDTIKKQLSNLEGKAEKSGKKVGNSLADGIGDGVKKGFGGVKGKVLALGSAIVSGLAVKQVVAAAIQQENAVNQLNTSLKLAGTFSTEASNSFQDLAKSIQANSTVGDETVLQYAALARNFTNTNEEAKKLTKASVDLAAATGMSLESAVKNLGKTYAGLTGELGESVPALRNLTAEQLKSGAAIKLITDRFGGAAQAQLNTFSGAVSQLSNTFGDFLEEIGDLIIKSPGLIKVVKDIGGFFSNAAKGVDELGKTGDVVGQVLISLISFAEGVNTFVVAPIELISNAVKLVFESIRLAAQSFISVFAKVALKVISIFSPDGETANALRTFVESSDELFLQFAENVNSANENLFNFDTATKGAEFLEGYKATLTEVVNANQEATEVIAANNKKVTKDTVKVQFDLNQTLANGIVQGTQKFVKALQAGDNAFKAFGSAIFGILGNLATQLGTTFISAGIGIDALKQSLTTFTGGQAIAAGIALVALGTLLSSLGGGSATSGQPAAGATAPTADSSETVGTVATQDEERQSLQAQVIVQGDVLDRRETGLAILEVLQEVGDSNDIRITT